MDDETGSAGGQRSGFDVSSPTRCPPGLVGVLLITSNGLSGVPAVQGMAGERGKVVNDDAQEWLSGKIKTTE